MRLDHLAFRVKDKNKTASFLMDAFGYRIQTEFYLDFDDGTKAQCFALEPPEKAFSEVPLFNIQQCFDKRNNFEFYSDSSVETWKWNKNKTQTTVEYHMAPEIFVSDGDPDSIVGKWVKQRIDSQSNLLHHIAYQVDDVKQTMDLWKQNGWAEFMTDEPIECPDLVQVFTKVHPLTNVIYEFINRGKYGFCSENVKKLMISSEEKCQ